MTTLIHKHKPLFALALLASASLALPTAAKAETDGWELLLGAAVVYAAIEASDNHDNYGHRAHYNHGGYYYRDGYRFRSKREYKRWRKHQKRLNKQRRRLERHIREYHGGYYNGGYCGHESHRYFSDSRRHRPRYDRGHGRYH